YHNQGRSVFVVTFSDSTCVVYKPKAIDADVRVFAFLEWVSLHLPDINLASLRMLSRNNYGWVEFAANTECCSQDDVSRYYQRAGSLLCIFYLLRAIDIHRDNLIAMGSQPIPIDLETIFLPKTISALPDDLARLRPLEEAAKGVVS